MIQRTVEYYENELDKAINAILIRPKHVLRKLKVISDIEGESIIEHAITSAQKYIDEHKNATQPPLFHLQCARELMKTLKSREKPIREKLDAIGTACTQSGHYFSLMFSNKSLRYFILVDTTRDEKQQHEEGAVNLVETFHSRSAVSDP